MNWVNAFKIEVYSIEITTLVPLRVKNIKSGNPTLGIPGRGGPRAPPWAPGGGGSTVRNFMIWNETSSDEKLQLESVRTRVHR